MVQNLTESLAHTPWILWVSVAVVALVAESVERGGWLFRIAGALLAGGLVAAIWPSGWWLQWLVALLVGVAAFVAFRRRPPVERGPQHDAR